MIIKCFIGVILIGIISFEPVIAQSRQLPNIILLLADDLGYRDLSCYGSTQVKTPNLDKLAAGGMRFTDFYAGSAVCSPSRAALMTGRSSVRAGIYSWIHTSHTMHLAKTEFTLAELLKEAGYATAHIGKWHLGYDLEAGSGPGPNPGDQGFDYWMATGNNAIPSHQNPNNFVREGKAMGEINGYSSHIVADEAIGWLQERPTDQPFFMNLWFHEPHQKVAAPDAYLEKHRDTNLPAYYGSIENMDAAIGRIITELENQGVSNQTLIIFMSDNGSYRGRYGSNGELTKGKTTLWEGGIRVPGVFKWPGVIKAGRIENRPAGVVDIFPTISAIVSQPTDSETIIDGSNLLPIFKNQTFKRQKPLYWFYPPSRPVAVIREGPWNLIADPELDIPRGNMFQEEYIGMIKETKLQNFRLYNLRNDPKQTTDVSLENPGVFEAMKKKMVILHDEIVDEAIDWRDFTWEEN